MKRKIIFIFSVLAISFASLLTTFGTEKVEANATLQNKIRSIQGERADNKVEVQQKEKNLKTLEKKMKKVEDEIGVIDHQTAATNQQIREKDKDIKATKANIEQLAAEIKVLEERIAERDELLKDRVRSMYINGGSVNYMEVILGANSFGDLVNRISALSTIAEQDRSILEAHHQDKMAVESAKALREDALMKLENQMAELEGLKGKLEEQRKEKDRLMGKLEHREGELHAELGELEESAEILASQEKAMQQELKAWQERQKRLEEERKRQRQQPLSSRGSVTHAAPTVTAGGQFMRPTTGSITSLYGARWGRTHHGIDFGKNGRSGDVPVVAAQSGTVISSYYSSSYGNTVMISHNVNGQVITTLYAHLENRFVSDGQRVEKGQLLGYMGNTGRSFGAHLHFEVHEGPWNGSKSNSVDPLRYIQ